MAAARRNHNRPKKQKNNKGKAHQTHTGKGTKPASHGHNKTKNRATTVRKKTPAPTKTTGAKKTTRRQRRTIQHRKLREFLHTLSKPAKSGNRTIPRAKELVKIITGGIEFGKTSTQAFELNAYDLIHTYVAQRLGLQGRRSVLAVDFANGFASVKLVERAIKIGQGTEFTLERNLLYRMLENYERATRFIGKTAEAEEAARKLGGLNRSEEVGRGLQLNIEIEDKHFKQAMRKLIGAKDTVFFFKMRDLLTRMVRLELQKRGK
ncbi:MAG: hypothetical protein QGI60_05440 [archaeon]|jgi:hypothetical protein|nr:hypothetical protein [archaeon]